MIVLLRMRAIGGREMVVNLASISSVTGPGPSMSGSYDARIDGEDHTLGQDQGKRLFDFMAATTMSHSPSFITCRPSMPTHAAVYDLRPPNSGKDNTCTR